jgi:uncharacterized protein (UPF0261 family)
METIAVLGTFDTKGREHDFVANEIRRRGLQALLIDVGTFAPRSATPDFPNSEIAMSGGATIEELREKKDRKHANTILSTGASQVIRRLADEGRIQGVISLSGRSGTTLCAAAMSALPITFPKMIVSSGAPGDASAHIGVTGIVIVPSLVDVSGLNRISRQVFAKAIGALCGMLDSQIDVSTDKPLIAATVSPDTADCVARARIVLEAAGYEVVVFQNDGIGGRSMEALVEAGLVVGVLDVTPSEWVDELLGGIAGAGPGRLAAAARNGVPAVIAPGRLDLCDFGSAEAVPKQFENRLFCAPSARSYFMRTNAEESVELARTVAEKINLSCGPASLAIPTRAISAISAPGQRFHDPIADKVLFQALRAYLRKDIPVHELNAEINDQGFAELCAEELLSNIAKVAKSPRPAQ